MQSLSLRHRNEHRVFLAEGSDLLSSALEKFLNTHGAKIAARAATAGQALLLAGSVDANVAIVDLRLMGDAFTRVLGMLRRRGIPVLVSCPCATLVPPDGPDVRVVHKPYSSEELLAAFASCTTLGSRWTRTAPAS